MLIRAANTSDAAVCAAIYAPIVRDTAISFELEPPTAEEFSRRITKTLQAYPWLVMEKGGVVAGYVYASEYRERQAWQWAVSCSVHIHPAYQRQGVGRSLYSRLFEFLRLQGYYHVFAGTTLPNAGSIALHEKMGFTRTGTDRQAGFKMGAWHDVCRWQLQLRALSASPTAPVPFSRLPQTQVEAA